MNELELIEALINRLKQVNAGFVYQVPENRPKPGEEKKYTEINYFDFDLPAARSTPPKPGEPIVNTDRFPYIITRATDGKVQQRDENLTNITFILGIYDNDLNHQGYKDTMLIMMRIRQDLFANPILENGAIFDRSFDWSFIDDQPYPYYRMAITTAWYVKSPQWTQHQEMI